jgi:hypothetical protein
VHGSGALVRWLLENELVDEINLLTYPVIIGQGTRLFADTAPDVALDLVDPNCTQRGDDPGLPDQRATGVRNVDREGKLATKLGRRRRAFLSSGHVAHAWLGVEVTPNRPAGRCGRAQPSASRRTGRGRREGRPGG